MLNKVRRDRKAHYDATVTSKGQVTVPLEVRTALGLNKGDKIEFYPDGRGGFALRSLTAPASAVFDYFKGEVMSAAACSDDEAIAEAVTKRDRATKTGRART
jgi:antitoxin PrlF